MKHASVCGALALLSLASLAGCKSTSDEPKPSIVQNDATAIRATLDTLYKAFSFDARSGADWNTIRDQCAEGAVFVAPITSKGTPRAVGIDEFLREFHEYVMSEAVRNTGLHERIVSAKIDYFGKIGHAYVAFEGFVPGLDVVTRRGLDSIQLVKAGDRWKVVSFTTQNETSLEKLPARFTK